MRWISVAGLWRRWIQIKDATRRGRRREPFPWSTYSQYWNVLNQYQPIATGNMMSSYLILTILLDHQRCPPVHPYPQSMGLCCCDPFGKVKRILTPNESVKFCKCFRLELLGLTRTTRAFQQRNRFTACWETEEHKRRMRDIYEKYGNQKAATSNYAAGASLLPKAREWASLDLMSNSLERILLWCPQHLSTT